MLILMLANVVQSMGSTLLCHLTRGMHVNILVEHDTADEFHLLRQRFASTYGMPYNIHSDNEESLKLANKNLMQLYKN